jgi:nucleotide-binding universal stress UspA family protein
MITLTDILVATDFSEPSMVALTYGRALARNFRARLHVMHVVGSLPSVFSGAEEYVVSVPDLQRQIEDAARQELEALAIDDEDAPPIRRLLMTSNAPHAAIVDYATGAHIGLIVAGTHGRGAVTHALIGSVAERIVRTARCPVLVVRNPEQEFVVPDRLTANRTAVNDEV